MPVAHELAGLSARRTEPDTIDRVIEPCFEHAQEVLASHTVHSRCGIEVAAKLFFENAVQPAHFLLLSKLKPVFRGSALPTVTVHSGRVEAVLTTAAPLCEMTFGFFVERHARSPALSDARSSISRH
jgi:hypothetical protein